MKYENMPKGRNKDICVRCGKRANFADRLKSDVQYDLLCLAETTSSGYMTHGNVKLCGKCMSELLMWLDADDFCSYGEREELKGSKRLVKGSEKPNNCETCRFDDKYGDESICSSCSRHYSDCYEPKDESQT